jgi:galactose mutarotase-like enzyme
VDAEPAAQLTLRNEQLEVVVDLERGADIVSLVDRRTGTDVLFRSPWAQRARTVARRGSALWHESSAVAWLEGYAGGWQLLCPNVAGPTVRAGVTQGFHGEAAVVPWRLVDHDESLARLRVELFSAPLGIDRTLRLDGPVLVIDDIVRNLSPEPVEFDYQHHPAFGAPFLAPGCCIETGAQAFVADPGPQAAPFEPGSAHTWPATEPSGRRLDRLPELTEPRALLGWLTDFTAPWAAVRNPDLDLAVALRWDASALPHAWLWQELGGTPGFPWFGRAYVLALEPSSTVTGGPGRAVTCRLDGAAERRIGLRLSTGSGRRPIVAVAADGKITYDRSVPTGGMT